jgi:hypothetical protein
MKLDAGSETLIRRYLLAAVTEDEREQIETRLMVDDDFFQQINLVEDELVDEYLDQVLSPGDRLRFEDIFLCAPERQHKLRFSKALRIYATNTAQAKASENRPEKAAWWQPILALLNPPRPVLAYSLATAVLSIAVGGPWTFIRISGLGNQIAALQAQQQNRDARESDLRSQYQEQRAKTDRIAAQLRKEKERWSALQATGGGRLTGARIPMVDTLSMLLSSGVTRDAQASQRLEIPKGATLVALKLDLPENRFKTYKAVLLSEGQEILSRSGLKASDSGSQILIRLEVPASDLRSGDYEIRLFGAGQNEFDSYVLQVIRK